MFFITQTPLKVLAITVEVSATVAGCGDGSIANSEQCDGVNLGGASCTSRGFSSGSLSCSSTCTFNTSSCANASGGGGGGGGGGISYTNPKIPETNVVFTGKAYPKSSVTILKDAQIVATTIADTNADFQTTISGLSNGNYIFSVYSEDRNGYRSSLLTFPMSIATGVTTKIGNIFVAPTISVDKNEVRRGDNIAIFGQTVGQADVIISVNSEEEFFGKTISDKNGVYLYNFDTSILEYGSHSTKSKASIGNQLISGFSHLVNFKVGTKNIKNEEKNIDKSVRADLNTDKRVNLVDFSIAAYWYKRPISKNIPGSQNSDLNNDGKIDLVDFSIMAFYWTG